MKSTMIRALATCLFCVVILPPQLRTGRASPEVPGPPQSRPIALVGGTIHPVSGPAIENGTLLFDDGRIVAVGRGVEIPENAERIDVAGRHVYPALFDAMTDLGLVEIDAVRATLDQRETGGVNPNVQARVAVNPDSELIPVARANGVLLALTAPSGGLVSGSSSVLQLDGWTYEDMTLKADVGLHVNWPDAEPTSDGPDDESRSRRSGSRDRDSSLDRLDRVLEDARAYLLARRSVGERQTVDARWESMASVLDGTVPVVVHADELTRIQAAVAYAVRHRLRLIVAGGYDAPRCADLLKQHDVAVIVEGVYRLPRRRHDPYDSAYTLPERLRRAGVRFCIAGEGRSSASKVRNLPYHAATAVAFGLPRDEALKAITIHPASILGVDDRVGTLEAGKDATLIVTDGDPLETPTQVSRAFVQGRVVDLSNRHKRLWSKYQQKYRR